MFQGWLSVSTLLISSVISQATGIPSTPDTACLSCAAEWGALLQAENNLDDAYDSYDAAYAAWVANPGPATAAALSTAEDNLAAAQASYDAAYEDWATCMDGEPEETPEPVLVSILER